MPRMRCFLALLLLAFCFLPSALAQAPGASNETDRKILRKTIPRYPEMARKIKLVGTVKLTAIVAPDGRVKSVQVVGGSPLLVQEAQDAVSQWKFASANAESKVSVELHFHPD